MKRGPQPAGDSSRSNGARLVVTLPVTILAVLVCWPYFVDRCPRPDCLSLWHRFPEYRRLSQASLVMRDFASTSTDGILRQIDDSLAPDARTFVLSVLGETNGLRLGLLFAINYHLFPRRVDISLTEPPRYQSTGWFTGQAGVSDAELASRGYDLAIDLGLGFQETQDMQLRRLTPRGAVRIPIQ